MFYWTKTHWLLKRLLPNFTWDIKDAAKTVYLTFDDGPTPVITPWVLQQLQQHHAKATFFCIGNNINSNPEIFQQTIIDGHAVGNHTYNHVNGWKTAVSEYLKDVKDCDDVMKNNSIAANTLFRPPYGKVNWAAAKQLQRQGYKIVMWDVLSADFDQRITKEQCLQNVLNNVRPGSIIIFHDSVKAFKNLEYALPRTLEFLTNQGYNCEVIR